MTAVTLRPDATVSNTGTVTGAATAHAALADDSDSSYLTVGGGQTCVLSLPDLAMPAGAVVRDVTLRIRTARTTTGSPPVPSATVSAGGNVAGGNVAVTWTTPTTITVVPIGVGGWTDSDIDAAVVTLTCAGLNVRVFEVHVDVVYVEKPVVVVTGPSGTVTDTNQPVITWTFS